MDIAPLGDFGDRGDRQLSARRGSPSRHVDCRERERTPEELLARKLSARTKSDASLTTENEQFFRYTQTLVQVCDGTRHQVAVPPGRRAVVSVRR